MTTELEAKLRNIGWFPNRRVAEEKVIEWLRIGVQDFGCHIFPEAVYMLREYGDLVLGNLHFTPEGSMARGERLSWLYLEWNTDEILFPIAYELGGTFTFALSSTGKVYADGVISLFCGDSFEAFLSNQLSSQKSHSPWVEVISKPWTPEMDKEMEQIYKAVYSNP